MVETSTNMFDLIVFSILGLSALLSFFRGFVREVLSLGGWILASVITLYAFKPVSAWVEPHVGSASAAGGIAAIGVFISVLIVISMVNRLLIKILKPGSEVGLLDNGLGLLFGLLRGALLIAVGYYSMALVIKKEAYPEWFNSSMSKPYVEKAAAWIDKVAPSYLADLQPDKDGKTPALDKILKQEEAPEDTSTEWQSMDELQRRMSKENN